MTQWRSLKLPERIEKSPKIQKIPKKSFLSKGKFPIISQEKGLINGYWDQEADAVKVDRPLVIFGDQTQVVKLIDFDFVVGADGVKVLKPREFLAPEYLYYYLLGHPQKELGYARHYRLLKELDVRFPILSEQQRIVSILDEAFAGIEAAIANTEKNLGNARELFESFTLALFSNKDRNWISATLKDVCATKITDGTHQTPKYFKSGYIFLSSRNVTSRKIDWDNVKYVDEAQHDEFQERMSPKVDDILLAKNGTTGVAALVDKDVVFDIYVSLALLRPSDKVLPRFLLHFVNSPIAGSQFKKRFKGIGVPNLHLREIRDVQIHYPFSILDQERICNEIDEIMNETQRLENIYKRKRSALTELKQSFLQRAFSGELTADKLESEVNQAIA